MLRQTKIKQEDKTELQIIRETLGYSRPMFAKKIIHRSTQMLLFYELKRRPIPDGIMALARLWLDFYKTQNKD